MLSQLSFIFTIYILQYIYSGISLLQMLPLILNLARNFKVKLESSSRHALALFTNINSKYEANLFFFPQHEVSLLIKLTIGHLIQAPIFKLPRSQSSTDIIESIEFNTCFSRSLYNSLSLRQYESNVSFTQIISRNILQRL